MKIFIVPVIRLLGSNTSIFSRRSTAPGDMFGNLREKFCFGYWGSCLTYLLALSLRKNPRLESSGEPISCSGRTKSIKSQLKGKVWKNTIQHKNMRCRETAKIVSWKSVSVTNNESLATFRCGPWPSKKKANSTEEYVQLHKPYVSAIFGCVVDL